MVRVTGALKNSYLSISKCKECCRREEGKKKKKKSTLHMSYLPPTLSTWKPNNSIFLVSTTPLPSNNHLGFFM